jgi:hypothetical protein
VAMPCDWKLWSCRAISRSCCEGSRFKAAGMVAFDAHEDAEGDVGEWSAARGMLVVTGGREDCYWRMEVEWRLRGRE